MFIGKHRDAANEAMIRQRLASDAFDSSNNRVDPSITAKLLGQFMADTALAAKPLPAQQVADTARFLGYGENAARLAVLVQDQTTDALPARPRLLAPDQPLPRTRRLG